MKDFAHRIFLALSAETPSFFVSSTEMARIWNAAQARTDSTKAVCQTLAKAIESGELPGVSFIRTNQCNGYRVDLIGLAQGICKTALDGVRRGGRS
jgi:hypothetical protein